MKTRLFSLLVVALVPFFLSADTSEPQWRFVDTVPISVGVSSAATFYYDTDRHRLVLMVAETEGNNTWIVAEWDGYSRRWDVYRIPSPDYEYKPEMAVYDQHRRVALVHVSVSVLWVWSPIDELATAG